MSSTASSYSTRPFVKSSALCDLLKFWVDHLLGFGENINQVFCLSSVAGSEEGIGCTSSVFAASASNTMDVIFRVIWVVIVDDELNIINIKATSRHVRGH